MPVDPRLLPGPVLRLQTPAPYNWPAIAGFFTSRGADCCERMDTSGYLRSLQIDGTLGWLCAQPSASGRSLQVRLSASLHAHRRQLRPLLQHLFDLQRNPAPVAAQLGHDALLAPLLAARPGLRIPGTIDGFELALRAVLGQQISVKAATTVFARFARHFGQALHGPYPQLTHGPPLADRLADCRLQRIIDRGLPRRRAETIQHLARAVCEQGLDLRPTASKQASRDQLLSLPGIGPWTVEYVALRALGDADALPAADLGLLKATNLQRPADLLARAEDWRPWRGYAALHLWTALGAGG